MQLGWNVLFPTALAYLLLCVRVRANRSRFNPSNFWGEKATNRRGWRGSKSEVGLRFHNYSLLESGGMLFLDTILLLVLFFYLDQVMPREAALFKHRLLV